jgi:hypothetical protein
MKIDNFYKNEEAMDHSMISYDAILIRSRSEISSLLERNDNSTPKSDNVRVNRNLSQLAG